MTEDDFSNEASERMTTSADEEELLQEIMEVSPSLGLSGDPDDNNENLESTKDDAKEEASSPSVNTGNATLQRKNRVESLEEGEVRYLWIGSSSSSSQPSRRRVPNCCAICLGQYEVNETVVWSCCHTNTNMNGTSSTGCNHAFHHDCMIDWLIKVRDGTPCPCCRQEFTDLPILPRRNKFRPAQQQLLQTDRFRNFDPSLFSFR